MKFELLNRVLLAVCCCFFQTAFAQDAGPLKIGFVDVQAVASKSPQLAEGNKRLEKEFSARSDALKGMQASYMQLRDRLQKEGLTMNTDDQRKLEDQILGQERKIRWEQGIMDEDFKIRRNQVAADVRKDIFKTIATLAQKEGYDLILTDGVLMSSARVNLTERVLTELKNNAGEKKK
ncbi:MAG TPA: OmpH family outer membrane protein [Gammaproteobacteria bacterium]|nr:OmpH family outer membrane protein [Gammaproteobacteria bacterium]